MIRAELGRRFGEKAAITHVDVSDPTKRAGWEEQVGQIQARGLVYPVTLVDGELTYDGAVSYPAILRAVDSRIAAATPAE